MAISKKIKGITIQFNGDTTNLGKALGDVESTVISTESELRKVNKALKDIDPNNAVLLAQKQDILNEAIEASKKKLKGLEDAQEQVEKQFKSGDIGADAYREFQRTIESTKKKLNGLETESDNLKKAQREMANNGADFAKEKIEDVGNAAKTEGKKINDLGDEFQNAEKDARNFGDGIDAAQVALGSLAADGIKGLGSALKDYAADSQTASNSFAAQTGATAEEMQKYSGIIDELYKNSFGESKNDVANAMALVKQTVGETDADKLKEMTESAMTLSDTFGFDVSEQLRAVNMLTKQFGISSEEAYNLIVQGAQKGLNKNGDLLDTINEYAVHYKQLGYTSDEFFNSLANGTASGTFSVDKLGDAVKEFGIRSKDTATTTTEGFTLIGLDADKMREKFAAGGESAKLATQETLKALFELDDQVTINKAGVYLFGTMWEDLGREGVEALMNTNGEIDKTEEALQKVKDVKYDDITTEITGLGREFQEEILKPVIEDFMPDIKNGMKWLKDNLPKLKPIIKGVGTAAVTAFAVNKISGFVSSTKNLVTTFTGMTGAIKGATAAQSALNIAQSAMPIAAVVAGAVALGTALKTVVDEQNKIETDPDVTAFLDAEQKRVDKIHEEYDEWVKTKEARDKVVNDTEAEFGYYRDLKTELDNIVTPTGQIKQGYEDRAKFILNELGDITETEIRLNGNVIENYKTLSSEIDKALKLKRGEAILGIYDDAFKESLSLTNNSEFLTNMETSRQKMLEAKALYEKVNGGTESLEYKWWKDAEGEYSKLEEQYQSALATIQNYEGLQQAIFENNIENAEKFELMLKENFITAEIGTEESLQKQVDSYKKNYEKLQQAVRDGAPYVTDEVVNQAKELYEKSKVELEQNNTKTKQKILDNVQSILRDAQANSKDGIVEASDDIKKTLFTLMDDDSEEISARAKSIAHYFGINLVEGVKEGVVDAAITEFAEGSPVLNTASGLLDAWRGVFGIQSPSKKTAKMGQYLIQGLSAGMLKEENTLYKTVNTVGTDTISTLKSQLDDLPTVSLNSRYTAAVKSGNITPALSGNKMFNISIGEFVNNTDRDIDTLAQQISVKLNNQMNQMQRGMGW